MKVKNVRKNILKVLLETLGYLLYLKRSLRSKPEREPFELPIPNLKQDIFNQMHLSSQRARFPK